MNLLKDRQRLSMLKSQGTVVPPPLVGGGTRYWQTQDPHFHGVGCDPLQQPRSDSQTRSTGPITTTSRLSHMRKSRV